MTIKAAQLNCKYRAVAEPVSGRGSACLCSGPLPPPPGPIGGNFSGIEKQQPTTTRVRRQRRTPSASSFFFIGTPPHSATTREHCAIYPGTRTYLSHTTGHAHNTTPPGFLRKRGTRARAKCVLFHLVAKTGPGFSCVSLLLPEFSGAPFNVLCVCVCAKRSSATRQPAGVNQVRACVRLCGACVVACCSIAAHSE